MDRRTACRIEWGKNIEYRVSQTDTFNPGILKNASVNGAMLWLRKTDITVGKTLDMRFGNDLNPVHMRMRVMRIEKTPHESLIGYGCKLEMMVSEAV